MTIPDSDKIMPAAAAKLMGVSRAAVHLAMKAGKLPRVVVAGRVFTSRRAAESYNVDLKNQKCGRGGK